MLSEKKYTSCDLSANFGFVKVSQTMSESNDRTVNEMSRTDVIGMQSLENSHRKGKVVIVARVTTIVETLVCHFVSQEVIKRQLLDKAFKESQQRQQNTC